MLENTNSPKSNRELLYAIILLIVNALLTGLVAVLTPIIISKISDTQNSPIEPTISECFISAEGQDYSVDALNFNNNIYINVNDICRFSNSSSWDNIQKKLFISDAEKTFPLLVPNEVDIDTSSIAGNVESNTCLLQNLSYTEYIHDSCDFWVVSEHDKDNVFRENALRFDFYMNGGYGGNMKILYNIEGRNFSSFSALLIPEKIYVDPFERVRLIQVNVYLDDILKYTTSLGNTTPNQYIVLDTSGVSKICFELSGIDGKIIMADAKFN